MVMTSAKRRRRERCGRRWSTATSTTFASSAVLKYLSPRWHEYHDQYAKWGYDGSNYPKDGLNGGSRGDSVPRRAAARLEPAVPARAAARRVGHRPGDQQPARAQPEESSSRVSGRPLQRHQRLATGGVDRARATDQGLDHDPSDYAELAARRSTASARIRTTSRC